MSDRPTLTLPKKTPRAAARAAPGGKTTSSTPTPRPRSTGKAPGQEARPPRGAKPARPPQATAEAGRASAARAQRPAAGAAPTGTGRAGAVARPGQRRAASAEGTPRPRPEGDTRRPARPGPEGEMRRPARPRREAPAPAQDDERLVKRVMAELECSRSVAEQAIALGAVQVQGQLALEPGLRVGAAQRVAVDRALLEHGAPSATLLLHKPARGTPAQALRLLQPHTHWAQDPYTGTQAPGHLARQHCDIGLEQIGSGLLVFTQDPQLRRRLQERMDTLEQELLVDVREAVDAQRLQVLAQLQQQPELRLPPYKVSLGSQGEQGTRLRFAVKGSHAGLVGYLCKQAGLNLVALHRTRIGRVGLGAVPAGQWRYLGAHERF
ncbi:MAG: hypothetical protein ACT4NV_15585 [Rhodoferax sp.]